MWWFLLISYSLTKLYIQWELPCDPLWAATSYPVGRPWSQFDMCSQRTAFNLPHHHQHFEITQFSVQFSSQLKSMKEEITYAFKEIKNNDGWGKFIWYRCLLSDKFYSEECETHSFLRLKKISAFGLSFFFFYNSPGRFPSVISLHWQSTFVRYCTLSHIVVLDLYTMLLICHWYGVVLNLKSQLFLVIPHYML